MSKSSENVERHRLFEHLQKLLGLPKCCVSVKIDIGLGRRTKVTCEYYPDNLVIPELTIQEFELTPYPQITPSTQP